MLSMPSFFLLTVSHYTLAQLPKASSAELCSVTQLCLTLWGPMDCSQPSSSARGIFQARILEWGAISYTRESFWSGDWTRVCWVSCRFFTTSTSWEAFPKTSLCIRLTEDFLWLLRSLCDLHSQAQKYQGKNALCECSQPVTGRRW